jgi:tetratricopeptide (TPR) repeat protein
MKPYLSIIASLFLVSVPFISPVIASETEINPLSSKPIGIQNYYAETYFNWGIIHYNQGKLDLALNDFNQAIKLIPNIAISDLLS